MKGFIEMLSAQKYSFDLIIFRYSCDCRSFALYDATRFVVSEVWRWSYRLGRSATTVFYWPKWLDSFSKRSAWSNGRRTRLPPGQSEFKSCKSLDFYSVNCLKRTEKRPEMIHLKNLSKCCLFIYKYLWPKKVTKCTTYMVCCNSRHTKIGKIIPWHPRHKIYE